LGLCKLAVAYVSSGRGALIVDLIGQLGQLQEFKTNEMSLIDVGFIEIDNKFRAHFHLSLDRWVYYRIYIYIYVYVYIYIYI